MNNRDPRVDACIQRLAAFAWPIPESLRDILPTSCPGVGGTKQAATRQHRLARMLEWLVADKRRNGKSETTCGAGFPARKGPA
jgi:hypothetical protein